MKFHIGGGLIFVCLAVYSFAALTVEVGDPSKAVDSQYILTFREDITDEARADHMKGLYKSFAADAFDNKIINMFTIGDFKGFSARLSTQMLASQLTSSNLIAIEQDAVVKASQSCSVQNNAVWGLDRIGERDLNLDGVYQYGSTGAGVDAYIVDTGINIQHTDFAGRVIWGANFADNTNTDCNGHGTHVAGTVGGTVYGVAKKATLIAVKVLDCQGSGTNAGVISGVNWVVSSRATRKRPSVANMSLGGGKSTALDTAVKSAITSGITFAVAAGNENADACTGSPSSVATAVTVGATGTDNVGNNQVDNRAYFSNFGTCVTLFAPGLMIESDWIGSSTATETISGTSMATPHVAGIVAVYLQQNPTATPASIKAWLVSNGSKSIVQLDCAGAASSCSKSPNVFAFSPCNA